MMMIFQKLYRLADRYSGLIFLSALFGLAWRYWQRWQRDITRLAEKKKPPPLPPLERWPDLPLVSVLVAAWNEAENIEGMVQSFLALRYPNKELILCAGGRDNTYELAKRFVPQITLLAQQPGEGKHGALRRCLPESKGTVIFLTDGDCILNSESVERLIYPVISGQETIATGLFRPLSRQLGHPFVCYQWVDYIHKNFTPSQYAPTIVGCNCALLRSVFETFWAVPKDKKSLIVEDLYLAYSLADTDHRILRVMDSIVETQFPDSFTSYLRQKTRWRRGALMLNYQLGRKWGVGNKMLEAVIGLLALIPIIPFLLLGRFGMVCWLLGWLSEGILPKLYPMMWLNQMEGEPTSPIISWDLLKLLVADEVVAILIFVEIWVPKWRTRW